MRRIMAENPKLNLISVSSQKTRNLSKQEAETLVIKVSGLSAKDDKAWADSVLQVTMQENINVFEKLEEEQKNVKQSYEKHTPWQYSIN